MELGRVVALVVVASALSVGGGYALGSAGSSAPDHDGELAPDDELVPSGEQADEPSRALDDEALRACEQRLSSAEEALARLPGASERAAIDPDPESLPETTRAALASPEASAVIEAEVERRIAERFERERERRREEWAARRAETRERLRTIGIDDETLARVTPAMCAMRDVFRQAWQSRRSAAGGSSDAGVRMDRRQVREATREMREEVEQTLGPERAARLEDEGGMRALGAAVECGDEEAFFRGPRR